MMEVLSQTQNGKAAQHCEIKVRIGYDCCELKGLVCWHKHEAKQVAEEGSGDREENSALALCALQPRDSWKKNRNEGLSTEGQEEEHSWMSSTMGKMK
ncbi:hypothetical protein KSP40_PGU013801 [Platanthera guangdongensis]|uniref:Uncharacterized protein n=1 Tax=Platanthera guangdongensis TaxID=2320717 RepID=A0ABR2M6D7_9ASPA